MKNHAQYVRLLALALPLLYGSGKAQVINWESVKKENRQLLGASLGMEYGLTFNLAYGYQLRSRAFPALITAEYSFPSGNQLFDDFKTKVGGQVSLIRYRHFQFSTRIQGVFRRYQNDLTRIVNFGSDMAGTLGYYRSRWFIAVEAGFDKAIVSNFKHSEVYKSQYPNVVDGWYQPPTGGNFYSGIQAGYSFRKYDLYLKAGKIVSQDFRTAPTLPMYGQLGCNLKF